MFKNNIILNESVDKTGLFNEYCVSKYVEGKHEIWNDRNHHSINTSTKYFSILNKNYLPTFPT
jgi:hypothetical protein